MTEEYSLRKQIQGIGLTIEITTPDKELLLLLDNVIRETVIKKYNLTG